MMMDSISNMTLRVINISCKILFQNLMPEYVEATKPTMMMTTKTKPTIILINVKMNVKVQNKGR